MPSCTLQNEDPDQGINNRGCICGSTTLPLLTVPSATDESQSCSYTAMPSSNQSNPITISTMHYTSNCQSCKLVGGIADEPSCTSISKCTPTPTATSSSKPTYTVYLSNNSIPIGDADNSNGGSDLRSNAYNQLRSVCPDSATACDSTNTAKITKIPTVFESAEDWEDLTFTVQDSHYDNTTVRDQMLSGLVSYWQAAASKTCNTTTYHIFVDEAMPCPSSGPVKRDISTIKSLEKRAPLIVDPAPDEGQKACDYTATLCSGPDHISTVMAGFKSAYDNYMDIQLAQKLEVDPSWKTFVCDLIIGGLDGAATAFAPELAPVDIMEDIDFEAICGEFIKGD
ncbi:MAG: hypothetical protein Q9165_004017 [Trypethelium subeluteriae]